MHWNRKAILFSALILNGAGIATSQAQEKLLYSFGATAKDGSTPAADLVLDPQGHLYGTTTAGGAHGSGTIFELTPNPDGTWSENILCSFGASAQDGKGPMGPLILDPQGNLYGTTSAGGSHGNGTAFELKKTSSGWEEEILYSFKYSVDHKDGSTPVGGLIFDKSGNLFGTTAQGGKVTDSYDYPEGGGTVFELSPAAAGKWTEKTIYAFTSEPDLNEGAAPMGSLVIDDNGNLFGTTFGGGGAPYAFVNASGGGTVFELSPSTNGYVESAVYGFAAGDPDLIPYDGLDGVYPSPNLVLDAQGNLFGTTNSTFSFETFSVTPDGTIFEIPNANLGNGVALLIEFGGWNGDAQYPQTGLVIDKKGNLYGTSTYGGPLGGYGSGSAGTVYEAISQRGIWSDKVLYSFGAIANDSAPPISGLIMDDAGNLYGTASTGGAHGKGTVFEIPAIPLPVPEFSPAPGIYPNSRSITISDAASDTAIYYTTDGSAPTVSSPKYVDPIEVSKSTTLNAIAVGPAEWQSAVKTAAYRIGPRATAPAFSVKAGTYSTIQTVAITDATAKATIYYTTNGDLPTKSSAKYHGPIGVSKSETLKAMATAAGDFNSAIASATYAIHLPSTAAPRLSVPPGTYASAQTVSITDPTPGAVIRYTLNGSTPTDSSPRYTAPIVVTETETIKALARAPQHGDSAIVVAKYTIKIP